MTKPPVAIDVDGSRELRRRLRSLEGGVKDLKAAHLAAATIVSRRAGHYVPRRTGQLASSIRPAGQAAGGVVRAGRKAVPQAGPIHFGWRARNIRPQPFLYEAIDDRRDEVIATYDRQIASVIKRHGLD